MNWKKVTKEIIVFTVIMLGLYDVGAAIMHQDATISVVIQQVSGKHPIIPFAFGVLMGHFFWQDQ